MIKGGANLSVCLHFERFFDINETNLKDEKISCVFIHNFVDIKIVKIQNTICDTEALIVSNKVKQHVWYIFIFIQMICDIEAWIVSNSKFKHFS